MLLSVSQSDGFAISMIAILSLSLGFLLIILIVMLRNAAKQNHEVDRLIDEVSDDEEEHPVGKHGDDTKPSEPWEKPVNWWRDDD